MSSLPANFESMHLSSEESHPKRVRQLVPEDIKPLRARQAEEGNHPENYSQRKEPEFFSNPKLIVDGGACKGGKKSLRKDQRWWDEKHADNQFDPALGNVPRNHAGHRHMQAFSRRLRGRTDPANTLASPAFHSCATFLGPPEVRATTRIDLDGLSLLDEKGDLHDLAGFEGGRLLHIIGAVASNAFGRFLHLHCHR